MPVIYDIVDQNSNIISHEARFKVQVIDQVNGFINILKYNFLKPNYCNFPIIRRNLCSTSQAS